MAEEEDTREVLFSEWMGADKTGLTIEQKGGGEIFVKEVKTESPAGRTGRVHEGTGSFLQYISCTYFDTKAVILNVSSPAIDITDSECMVECHIKSANEFCLVQ